MPRLVRPLSHLQKYFASISLAITLILVLSFQAFAQRPVLGNELTHPKPGDGHDYVTHLQETVNPATGYLNVTIPLPIAKSRGLNLPLSLTYNSAQGHRTQMWYTGHSHLTSGSTWDLTVPLLSYNSWNQFFPSNGPGDTCSYTGSYAFLDPQGGRHGLTLAGTTTLPAGESAENCTDFDTKTPIGPGEDSNGSPGNPPTVFHTHYDTNFSWTEDSYSAAMLERCDGFSTTGLHCGDALSKVEVTDPEGNTYSFFAQGAPGCDGSGLLPVGVNVDCANHVLPTTVTDRNGNIIQFNSPLVQGANGVFTAIDTNGRTMIKIDQKNAPNTIIVSGLSYVITPGLASANYTEPSNEVDNIALYHGLCSLDLSDTYAKSVLTSFALPNGTSYTFKYDPTYGLLREIKYPSGEWAKYTWKLNDTFNDAVIMDALNANGPPLQGGCKYQYKSPVVATRSVGTGDDSDSVTPDLVQTFTYLTNWDTGANAYRWLSKVTTVLTQDNISGHTFQNTYTYSPTELPLMPNQTGVIANQIPLETDVKTSFLDDTNSTQQEKTEAWAYYYYPASTITTTTDSAGNTVKARTDVLKTGGLLVEKYEYDTDAATLLRKTNYSYFAGVPCLEKTVDGSGHVLSEIDSVFDGGTQNCGIVAPSGVTQVANLPTGTHDEANYSATSTTPRGNITRRTQWNGSGSSIVTTYAYDSTGQLLSMTDGCGNTTCTDMQGTDHTTTLKYTDSFADTAPSYQTNSYVTSVTKPLIGTSSETYRFSDGLLASTTDVNSQTTTYEYNDPLLRLTAVKGPALASGQPLTTYAYNDTAPNPTETVTVAASPSPGQEKKSKFDGFGRLIQVQQSDPQGNVYVDTVYDGMGRAYKTSNPYRTGDPLLYTQSNYDSLGRVVSQVLPDQSTRSWQYRGLTTVETNETGVHWSRTSDALGRLTKVLEPNLEAPTVTICGPQGCTVTPNYGAETDYTYNGLDLLTSVTQKDVGFNTTRSRSFIYDPLGRLVGAVNPESGTICYGTTTDGQPPNAAASNCSITSGYDANGNLKYKTDARRVTTSYSYDVLNRLTSKSYSDGTHAVAFAYDGKDENQNLIYPLLSNAVGRMSHSSNGVNAATNYSYDSMGRVVGQTYCIPIDCSYAKSAQAVYDLAGNMTSMAYPDSRKVSQGFDGAGRMNAVKYDSWNGVGPAANYLTVDPTTGYDPAGHLVNATFGNGVVFGAVYDNRERVQKLQYGPDAGPLWSKKFAWTSNSNLQSQTDLITGIQRQFGYDSLNRLVAAQDIFTNLAVPSASNGWTSSTSTSGSGAASMPGASGAMPWLTNPDDSNMLSELGGSGWSYDPEQTVVLNAVTAPDGSMTAATATAKSGSTDSALLGTVSSPQIYDGETLSASVWMRVPSGTMSIGFYIVEVSANGWNVAAARSAQLTTSWQQFQVSATVQNTSSQLWLQIGGGGSFANGQTFQLWNPMLEDAGTSGTSVTNFLPYSQNQAGSNWSGTAISTQVNSGTAPDGSQTAATVTGTGANPSIVTQISNPAPFAQAQVTASVFLRTLTGTLSTTLTIAEWWNGNIYACGSPSNITLTTSWQRFSYTCTAQAALSQIELMVNANQFQNGSSFQMWGAQMELASTAGPYVPTGATPATASTNLTNILSYSQQPNGPTWWATSGFSGVVNHVVAPDGSMTGYEATAVGGPGWITNDVPNQTLYNNETATASVYLRVPSGSGAINFYLIGENASGRVLVQPVNAQLTTTWQRFSVTAQLPNGMTRLLIQLGDSETAGQVVDVWGSQLELNSHAGPYVATSALPVTAGSQPVNLIPNSQSLSGPSASVANGSIAVSSATAPDGTMSAATVTADANSTDSYLVEDIPNPSLYDNETVTASVYLRIPSGTQSFYLYIGDTGINGPGFGGIAPVTLTTQWQRFSVTGQLHNGLTRILLQVAGAGLFTHGQSFQIWGPQFVVGSSADPYTPTSSTTTVLATSQPGTLVPTGLNETYGYDSFGNILQNGGFNATYDANNRMNGYAYDASGNLLSNGVTPLTWDAESRLTSAAGATYIYDAEGNRVEKQGVGVTDTIYFGGRPIARLSAGLWTDLIYGPNGLLAEVAGAQTAQPTYRLLDHLGTEVGQTDASAELINPLDYTPFGRIFTGNTNDPYLFTGKERDAESGLDYFGARYYASNMGRWMSPDWADKPEAVPYSTLDDPQSLNLYGYVYNNPVSSADADGHWPDFNDVGNFVTGVVTAIVSDNTVGVVKQPDIDNASYQLGSGLGHAVATVQGVAEALGGAGVEAGGIALDATGVGALIGVPANVAGAGMMLHGVGTAATGFTHLFSKRTGDFTPTERKALDDQNKAQNSGGTKCADCGKDIRSVANEKGKPTPPDQLQRHHDPQLNKRGGGKKSPGDRLLCPACHKVADARLRANGK